MFAEDVDERLEVWSGAMDTPRRIWHCLFLEEFFFLRVKKDLSELFSWT